MSTVGVSQSTYLRVWFTVPSSVLSSVGGDQDQVCGDRKAVDRHTVQFLTQPSHFLLFRSALFLGSKTALNHSSLHSEQ